MPCEEARKMQRRGGKEEGYTHVRVGHVCSLCKIQNAETRPFPYKTVK